MHVAQQPVERLGGEAAACRRAVRRQLVAVVGDEPSAVRELRHARAFGGETGGEILRRADARAREVVGLALQHRSFPEREPLGIQRRGGRQEHQLHALGPVQPDVREDRGHGRSDVAQQRLVDELRVDPYQQHAVRRQARARELEETARIEVGGAGGPRVRGLRHQDVVAARREHQRVACIVLDQPQPRIGERIVRARGREAGIGVDHARLQLDHIDGPQPCRDVLHRDPSAESDDEHAGRFGPCGDRQRGEPALAMPYRRRAGATYGRLREAVGAQIEAAVVAFLDEHRRRAPDREEALLAGGGIVDQRRVDDGARQRWPEQDRGGQSRRGRRGLQRSRDIGERPQRHDRGGETEGDGEARGALERERRDEPHAGGDGAGDRADGVERVDAPGRARRVDAAVAEQADQQRESGAHEERGRQHREQRPCRERAGREIVRHPAEPQLRRRRGERDADLCRSEGERRAPRRQPPRRGEAAEADAEQEARQHGRERREAAAERVAQHARPQHLIGQCDEAAHETEQRQQRAHDAVRQRACSRARRSRRRRGRGPGRRGRPIGGSPGRRQRTADREGARRDQQVERHRHRGGDAQAVVGHQPPTARQCARRRAQGVRGIETGDARAGVGRGADREPGEHRQGRAHQHGRHQQQQTGEREVEPRQGADGGRRVGQTARDRDIPLAHQREQRRDRERADGDAELEQREEAQRTRAGAVHPTGDEGRAEREAQHVHREHHRHRGLGGAEHQ